MVAVDVAGESIVVRTVNRNQTRPTIAIDRRGGAEVVALEIPAFLGRGRTGLQLFEEGALTRIRRIEMRVGAGRQAAGETADDSVAARLEGISGATPSGPELPPSMAAASLASAVMK